MRSETAAGSGACCCASWQAVAQADAVMEATMRSCALAVHSRRCISVCTEPAQGMPAEMQLVLIDLFDHDDQSALSNPHSNALTHGLHIEAWQASPACDCRAAASCPSALPPAARSWMADLSWVEPTTKGDASRSPLPVDLLLPEDFCRPVDPPSPPRGWSRGGGTSSSSAASSG